MLLGTNYPQGLIKRGESAAKDFYGDSFLALQDLSLEAAASFICMSWFLQGWTLHLLIQGYIVASVDILAN